MEGFNVCCLDVKKINLGGVGQYIALGFPFSHARGLFAFLTGEESGVFRGWGVNEVFSPILLPSAEGRYSFLFALIPLQSIQKQNFGQLWIVFLIGNDSLCPGGIIIIDRFCQGTGVIKGFSKFF